MYWQIGKQQMKRFRPKGSSAAAVLRLVMLIAIGLLSLGLLWSARPVHAATIEVNTTADDVTENGNCTLREAIIAANTNKTVDGCNAGIGVDTVVLPAGNYKLSLAGSGEDLAQTGDLDITQGLQLSGAGRIATIIDANGLDRVFEVMAGNVHLNGVTITGGNSGSESGGGIFVGNGSLTMVNGTVANNRTGGDTFHGGGIYFSGDTLTLSVMQIEDNTATGVGGGLYVDYNTEWTMASSRVENNTASGDAGINNRGTATIRNSLISGNTATGATDGGGGMTSSGELTLVNSTISGNSAPQSGGGLVVGSGSTASLYNVTITNNTADADSNGNGDGGGIRIASGTVKFQNTIIAGNFDKSSVVSHPDCSGTFESLGYNLVQNTTGCTITGDTTGNKTGVNPKLEPLASNGGSTMTHALPAGSPAIDGGNPAGCSEGKNTSLTVDQRGYARPIDGDGNRTTICDMGAFEYLSPGVPTQTPSPTATATATKTATPAASAMPTVTFTPSPVQTSTPGPSPTATATFDPEFPPTATNTATPGPSPTATATFDPEFPPTATETATPGPSPTATTPFVPSHWLYLPVNLDG